MSSKSNLYAQLLLKRFFPKMQKMITKMAKSIDKPSQLADNVDLVSGRTAENMTRSSDQLATSHFNSMNNPHNETAESIGTSTKQVIDSRLAGKMPMGSIPIFTYGYIENASKAELDSRWHTANYILSSTVDQMFVMNGTVYNLPAQSLDLRTVNSAPANKTFYVYMTLRFGIPRLQVNTSPLPDTYSRMYIGKITTNGSGGAVADFNQVVRIDLYRISEVPAGQSIPATGGKYNTPVLLPNAWKP